MHKKILKVVISICLAAAPFFVHSAMGAPALDIPTVHNQPDGSTIEVYTYGDEHYSFIGDSEGYMLRYNDDGTYSYVTGDTSARFSQALGSTRPAGAVRGFDMKPSDTDTPDRMYMTMPSNTRRNLSANYSAAVNEGEAIKETKLLVVGIDFANVKLSDEHHSPGKIYDMFFATGDGTVSVDSYYNAMSGGRQRFVPAFKLPDNYIPPADGYGRVEDGVIKIKINSNHPDPVITGTTDEAVVGGIVSAAMSKLDDIVDFAEFDTDGADENDLVYVDNDELTICFLVAGYEASAGNRNDSVWAHQMGLGAFNISTFHATDDTLSINGETYPIYLWRGYDIRQVTPNEVGIFVTPASYAMIGAMYNSTNPMGIGAICHELGHVLGLPDLYNTTGTKVNYADVSTLSIMAAGSWGKSADGHPGTLPTALDPWSKLYLGWYGDDEILEIDWDDKIVADIVSASSSQDGYKCIKINTKDADEYYLLENRTIDGFDAGLKYYYENSYYNKAVNMGGVALWHIDNSILYRERNYLDGNGVEWTNTGIDDNNINTTSTPGIAVERSGKGDSVFYDDGKPMWRSGVNSMPLFGKLSYPTNVLNTYTTDPDSGVEIRFMSAPGDAVQVGIGGEDVVVGIADNGSKLTFKAYNNTSDKLRFFPVMVYRTQNVFEDVIKFPEVSAESGASQAVTCNDTMMNGVQYRLFFLGLAKSESR